MSIHFMFLRYSSLIFYTNATVTRGRTDVSARFLVQLIIGKFGGVRGKKGVFFNSIYVTFTFYYPYYAAYYYQFKSC